MLPAIPSYDVGYDHTARYHFPLLIERNATGYASQNVTTTLKTGPFGFDEAVHIGKSQCVVKSNFALDQDRCIRNPKNCLNGFSLSIWERVLYGEEVFNVKMLHQKKYILSTGGDFSSANKKAYPGVAIYHEGIDLIAVVSTGEDVWYLKVTGQLVNETWSNIGIRWSAFNSSSNSPPFHLHGGLEMFINAKKVGQALHPMTRPGADMTLGNPGKWTMAPILESLSTFDVTGGSVVQKGPVFMVGCHRNAEDETFRDFGMTGSVYDELAFWGRSLITNQTVDEAFYFTGGFMPGFDGISDEEWLNVLDHVRLDVPEQLEAAGEITYRLYGSRSEEMSYDQLLNFIKENEEEKMNALKNATNQTSSYHHINQKFSRSPEQQISYDRQRLASMTVEKLLMSRGSPFVRPKDLRRVFKVVGSASFPIIPTMENIEGWKSVQMDPGEEGASKIVKEIMDYTRDLLQTANINHPEDFYPMFSAARDEMVIHVQSDGMMLSAMKFDPNQFQRTGTFHEIHSFYANHPMNPNQGWDKYPEHIEFPTRFHFKNSSQCAHLPITFVQAIFDGYGAMAPLRRNPANIYSKEIKLDSKGVSMALGIGPDPKDVTKTLNCQIDTDKMKYDPIKIRFMHYDTKTSQRKLLWTQDLDSNIEQRKCAYFNPNFGPYGGWDASGCTTIITEQTSTTCECSTFGTFAVVAEIVQDPFVPEEDVWVKVIKYCGFFFSLICLVPMMVVIALSPVLHDMFHWLRFHSALNFFISLIVILITQSESICEERTTNILFSGLQQYFFLTTTMFLGLESFATLRATTKGIIGGYISAYVSFSYGLPFINMGLTMFLYGEDYGKDPRCFIGWENSTKFVFFYHILIMVSVAFVLCLIVIVNLTTPQTRRESIIDQLASQGRGMVITVFIWTITWYFGYPTYIRYPDHELPDFYPIFIILFSWFGVVMFIFLGLTSARFRAVVLKFVWPQRGSKYATKNEETETELSEMSKSPSVADLNGLDTDDEQDEKEKEPFNEDLEQGFAEEDEQKDNEEPNLDDLLEGVPGSVEEEDV